MSGCHQCPDRGFCCRDMVLRGGNLPSAGDTGLETLNTSRETVQGILDGSNVPFYPARRGSDGRWRFECTNLGDNGLCKDYENRPQTCHNFEVGVNPRCLLTPKKQMV